MGTSGLVGAFAVWIVVGFIIPQISSILSEAAKLHKNWSYKDTEEGNTVGTAVIRQYGNKVKITATRTAGRDGGPANREFIYKGKITGKTLVLQYQQKDAGNAITGAIVLRLESDLATMKGTTSYFSDTAGSVISHQIYYYAQP